MIAKSLSKLTVPVHRLTEAIICGFVAGLIFRSDVDRRGLERYGVAIDRDGAVDFTLVRCSRCAKWSHCDNWDVYAVSLEHRFL